MSRGHAPGPRCRTCSIRLRLGDPGDSCVDCWLRRTSTQGAAHGCHDEHDDRPPPDWWDYAAYAAIAVVLFGIAIVLGYWLEVVT